MATLGYDGFTTSNLGTTTKSCHCAAAPFGRFAGESATFSDFASHGSLQNTGIIAIVSPLTRKLCCQMSAELVAVDGCLSIRPQLLMWCITSTLGQSRVSGFTTWCTGLLAFAFADLALPTWLLTWLWRASLLTAVVAAPLLLLAVTGVLFHNRSQLLSQLLCLFPART